MFEVSLLAGRISLLKDVVNRWREKYYSSIQ
jgi:hypothetical protein